MRELPFLTSITCLMAYAFTGHLGALIVATIAWAWFVLVQRLIMQLEMEVRHG